MSFARCLVFHLAILTIGLTLILNAPLFAADEPNLDLPKLAGSKPRSVIFILVDDHRYDAMGFLDHPFLKTPNLDALAKSGAYLKNAFVTTSLCSPSRASILTGQYMHNHGVVDNNELASSDNIFFPQYLQKAGYKTAFIGKWHMGGASDDPRPGFDRWVSFRGFLDRTIKSIDGE